MTNKKDRFSEVLPLPVRVDIEPTIQCNFRCKICQRTYWDRASKEMTFDQFKKLINQIPNVKQLKLQGMGEPLLNLDFFKMVRYSKQIGIEHVSTYTNGSLLYKDKINQEIINSGIDLVRVSIDASNQEKFERIRPGANYLKIFSGLESLSNLALKHGKPMVEIWTVITSENIDECMNIIDLAKSVNVSIVNYQVIMNTFDYKPEIRNKLLQIKAPDVTLLSMVNLAKDYALETSINLNVQNSKSRSPQKPCHWPFDSTFISVEGYIVPCCTIADPRVINMGNIFQEDFEQIWIGDRYQEFRRSILDYQLHQACLNCYQLNRTWTQ